MRYYALLLIAPLFALLLAIVAPLSSDAPASAATVPNHALHCTHRWQLVNGRFVSCNPSWAPSQVATSPSPAPSATPSPSPSPGPAPSPSPAPSGTSVAAKITFYAALDNDPAGSRDIAYPGAAPRHSVATTDAGAYSHPITAAVKAGWLKSSTIIYVSELHKYYVVEDSCAGCSTNWVDLYMSNSVKQGVTACEDMYTGDDSERHTIIINPPSTLAVDSALLYTDSAGCAFPAQHYAG